MALTLVRSLRLLLSRQHKRLASSQSSIEEWQKEKKKRISALENELRQLEKQHNYPRKPIVHPVTLYVLEELEMTKGMTGLGSSVVNKDIISPKNLYTECNRKWKSGEVPESIKEKFRRRAENKKQEYEKAVPTPSVFRPFVQWHLPFLVSFLSVSHTSTPRKNQKMLSSLSISHLHVIKNWDNRGIFKNERGKKAIERPPRLLRSKTWRQILTTAMDRLPY